MNILVLGRQNSPLSPVIRKSGHTVIEYLAPIEVDYLKKESIDFVVSFGYHHILPQHVINYLPDSMINLHISFLPWNRGADPNLWSFLEETPSGVSLHIIDKGVDTGDILVQEKVQFLSDTETLASTYKKLSSRIVTLFEENWPAIIQREIPRKPQPDLGSFHKLADKNPYQHLLINGWDTPIKLLRGIAKKFNPNDSKVD